MADHARAVLSTVILAKCRLFQISRALTAATAIMNGTR